MIEYFYASLLNSYNKPFIMIDERKIKLVCKMLIWYKNNSKKRERRYSELTIS